MKVLFGSFRHIDWMALLSALGLSLMGLITMNSFSVENSLFDRQVIWLALSLAVFFMASIIDWRFLRRRGVIIGLYVVGATLLIFLFGVGEIIQGARSWFNLGPFSFQPSDLAKLALIAILAKYFSRRHIEIANFRHVIISGTYSFILFLLIAIQPDFGSAVIVFLIWFGMVFVSGISRKHLFAVVALGAIASTLLWSFGFADYQKDRILTFLNPLSDIHGAGYNAYQSTIAVGSGGFLGKGIGYGTQSKLQFLPEYETDFIFAAYAEEWGFVGVVLLF